MRGVTTVLGRELRGYFNSVIAYIFIIVFLLVSCGLYMTTFFLQGVADMRPFFSVLPFILLVFLPAVTMRLWAEEKSMKTEELLLTCPLPTWVFVVGKFLAAFLFYLSALAGTLVIPIMLAALGDPDGGAIAAGYLGAVLLGAFLLALGVFLSALSRDQIVAFVLSLAIGFALYLQGMPFVAEQIDGWVPGLGTLLARACGLAQRFDDFSRGVVPLQAVFFFLAGTFLFLVLNAMVVERRGRPRSEPSFAGGMVLVVTVTVLAVLVVAALPGARLDWTEAGVYTLSPATGKILSRLEDKVRITYFVSPEERMPTAMKRLGRDVKDKLEELAHASGGNVEVLVLDPTDTEVAERAEELGVEPFQVQSLDRDEMSVKLVTSSLVLSYLDKDEVVPQVHPGNFPNLEYEVVSRLYRLLRDEPPLIALDAARQEMDPQMAQIYQQMGRPVPPPRDLYAQAEQFLRQAGDYRVEKIDLGAGDEIPEEAETVVLLEPSDYGAEARDALARFLARGGSVVVALQDRLFQYEPAGRRGMQATPEDQPASGLEELLARYGLHVQDEVLMDTESEMLSIPTRTRLGGFDAMMETPVRFPVQIHVVRDNLSQDAPALGMTSSLLYLWGSALRLDAEQATARGLETEVLFTSTDNAWLTKVQGALEDSDMDPAAHESMGPYPLAVLVRGSFPPPPAPESAEETDGEGNDEQEAAAETEETGGEDGDSELLAEGEAEGRLVLVGSARMFSDGILQAHDNALFLLNAVDTLTLGPELVEIRGKSLKPRTFETPSQAGKIWWRFFAVALVPLLVAVVGLLRAFLRKQARERYRQQLQRAA